MTEKKTTTIDFPWNWEIQMNSLIMLLENGNHEGRESAREELMKLARQLDEYNEQKKANKLPDDYVMD